MDKFDEYVKISEFINKVSDEVSDKFYIGMPNQAIILILKRYEEFKKEMERE